MSIFNKRTSKSYELEKFKDIKEIIEPLTTSLLIEKPEEPILFMIEWVQNFFDEESKLNSDRIELLFLKKEIKKYENREIKEKHILVFENDDENDEDSDEKEGDNK